VSCDAVVLVTWNLQGWASGFAVRAARRCPLYHYLQDPSTHVCHQGASMRRANSGNSPCVFFPHQSGSLGFLCVEPMDVAVRVTCRADDAVCLRRAMATLAGCKVDHNEIKEERDVKVPYFHVLMLLWDRVATSALLHPRLCALSVTRRTFVGC
jgi:hypothetical protein